jgi:NADPH:quinone reductase-like Zn-dependent oxidoreductase
MKAWIVAEQFGLDRLQQVTRELPEPGPGELRLRLRAVSLNYRDLLMVRGHYDPRQPLPLVPCSDGVGIVDAVGEGVDDTWVGKRVCPIFLQAWHDGPVRKGMLKTTLGGPLDGTLREAMVVPVGSVVEPPEHFDDAEAASLVCAGVTAWRALVTEGGVGEGDRVATLGTGGVSLFALQIARMRGASVAITSSSDAKLERAKALGADFVRNYVADPRWGGSIAAWADGEGVDNIVELGGAGTLDQSLRAVRPGGQVSLIGVLSGVKAEVALTRILMRGIRVQGVLVGSRADFEGLVAAYTANPDVRPVIDRVFDFDEAAAAFRYLKSGAHFGKVVVRV